MRNKITKKQIDKPIIKVKNISKSFILPHERISTLRGAFVNAFKKNDSEILHALKDVSFEVARGEFLGIIGRNGSGKSTLLKILAGVYVPDSGSTEITEKISPFLELGIGFNPELSGRDNVYLNATVLGMSKDDIDEKYNSIVAFSELERFMDQKIKNYSSGMQVRLAFSVAIHANREILLMDEVLAVGDSNFQTKCLSEFMKYRLLGRTIILVTHDINTIQRYCDRAMLLKNGEVVKIGKPQEVGDEYIRQNIQDENERIKSEIEIDKGELLEYNAESLLDKEIEKNAKIIKVDLLNKDGDKQNIFETGDEVLIKIYFTKSSSIKELNFGIGLYRDDGVYVFGYNTQMDNYKLEFTKNYVILHLKDLAILKGDYYIRCVCFGDFETKFYDFVDKAGTFQVFSLGESGRYRGMLNIEHYWK